MPPRRTMNHGSRCKVVSQCFLNALLLWILWLIQVHFGVDCLPYYSGMVWGCDNGTAHSESHWCEPRLLKMPWVQQQGPGPTDGVLILQPPTGGSAWWVERPWAVSTWRNAWKARCHCFMESNHIRQDVKVLNTGGQGRRNALYRLYKIWFNAGNVKNTVHIESQIVLVAFSNCAWFNIQKMQKVCPLCLSPSPPLRATNPCLEIHCQPLMIFRCSHTGEYASTTCGNHIMCFWLQLWRDRQHRDDCSSSSVWCWFPVFPFNLYRRNTRFNDVMNHVHHADFIACLPLPVWASFLNCLTFQLGLGFFPFVGANLHTYILTQWNWIAKITVELDAGYAVCQPFCIWRLRWRASMATCLHLTWRHHFDLQHLLGVKRKLGNHGAFHHRTNVPYHCFKLRLSCHYIGRHPQVLRAQGWDVATRDRPRCRDL